MVLLIELADLRKMRLKIAFSSVHTIKRVEYEDKEC